jgi:adenine C2-methylase RlmN of 23S rRNA A2503 and tRNA A37
MKNLDAETIYMQVVYVNNYLKTKFGKKEDGQRHMIRNVVFMGMGEPLLNYDNVK